MVYRDNFVGQINQENNLKVVLNINQTTVQIIDTDNMGTLAHTYRLHQMPCSFLLIMNLFLQKVRYTVSLLNLKNEKPNKLDEETLRTKMTEE